MCLPEVEAPAAEVQAFRAEVKAQATEVQKLRVAETVNRGHLPAEAQDAGN